MPNAPQRLALRTLHDSTEILTDKMAEQERRLGLFGWLLFMSRPVRVLPNKNIPPFGQGWDISHDWQTPCAKSLFRLSAEMIDKVQHDIIGKRSVPDFRSALCIDGILG